MIHIEVVMTKTELTFFSKLFPFHGLRDDTLERIISSIETRSAEYERGDIILSADTSASDIGFVVNGTCEVAKIRHGDTVPLNTLERYSSFGVLSVFHPDGEFPTCIRAKSRTKIMYISGTDLISLVKHYPTVAMNVISFLAKRIAFLNDKIATFSGKGTIKKIASYLLSQYSKHGDIIPFCGTKTASAVSIGRASLYRALSALEGDGIIKLEQKQITIISPDGLERISK